MSNEACIEAHKKDIIGLRSTSKANYAVVFNLISNAYSMMTPRIPCKVAERFDGSRSFHAALPAGEACLRRLYSSVLASGKQLSSQGPREARDEVRLPPRGR